MPELVISLNNNILRASCINKDGFHKAKTKLDREIGAGSRVLNVSGFTESVVSLVSEMFEKPRKDFDLVFVVEPADAFLRLVTIKNTEDDDVESQIVPEVTKTLEGVTLEELYFSYHRVAPFVYQFIGVRKAELDKYLEISNALGYSLKGIFCWSLLLPKFAKFTDLGVFVVKNEGVETAVLSEYGGVKNFVTLKGSDATPVLDELMGGVETLGSKKVFSLAFPDVQVGKDYKLKALELPNGDTDEVKGSETHLLTHFMIGSMPELMFSFNNLLRLLPVPAVEKKSAALVYTGAAAALVLILGATGFYLFGKDIPIPLFGEDKGDVLSEETNLPASPAPTTPPVPAESVTGETPEESEVEETMEVAKEDLSILIENGAGVAGLAGRTKDFLEDLDYNVHGVGDAEIVGRQNTLLKFKKEFAGLKDEVVEDMSENYLDIIVEDDLDEDAEYNLLIVVGTDIDGI
jgi:hypothetical protein